MYGGNSEEYPVPDMESVNTIVDSEGNVTDYNNEEYMGYSSSEYDENDAENDFMGEDRDESEDEQLFGDEMDPDLVDNDDGSDF